MKELMKKQLIKDIVIAVVAWAVMAIVFIALAENGIGLGIFAGFMCAGLPFGWRWMSKVIVSVSLYGIVIKAVASIFLGWIALPIIIIKDIIDFVKAE